MKWKNKGHEFDNVYENIKKRSKLYLFGAGEYGEKIYELLSQKKLFKDLLIIILISRKTNIVECVYMILLTLIRKIPK